MDCLAFYRLDPMMIGYLLRVYGAPWLTKARARELARRQALVETLRQSPHNHILEEFADLRIQLRGMVGLMFGFAFINLTMFTALAGDLGLPLITDVNKLHGVFVLLSLLIGLIFFLISMIYLTQSV
jgi:hypothetical protein